MLSKARLFSSSEIAALSQKYSRVFVAYSGGVDSHVLLDLAAQCFPNLFAIHINHKQSALDDAWQQHCEKVCADLNIPLQCVAVDLTEFADQSFELSARNARHNAWRKSLGADDLLLLAHHADDQAETILFRFLRGSGPRGLCGMHKISKLQTITLMRPLLTTRKADILVYAKANNLNWIEDRSNLNNLIDRNFLRNTIIPALQTRWPEMVNTINRNGVICKQLLQNLEPQLQHDLQTIVTAGKLNIRPLVQHAMHWQAELLRAWLLQHLIRPNAKQLNLILQQVVAARIDAIPQFQIGSRIIRRARNKLFVMDQHYAVSQKYCLSWDLAQPLVLPDGKTLQAVQVFSAAEITRIKTQALTVRSGVIGRKAKKIFQEYDVPPWERTQYPLVFANDRLVSIVGLWNSPR